MPQYRYIWIVDGKSVVSGHYTEAEAVRKARAEPGATVHKERVKINPGQTKGQIIQGATSGYSQRKGCSLWTFMAIGFVITVIAWLIF